jgi:hypothetical protein
LFKRRRKKRFLAARPRLSIFFFLVDSAPLEKNPGQQSGENFDGTAMIFNVLNLLLQERN